MPRSASVRSFLIYPKSPILILTYTCLQTEFVDFFDNAPIALHWLSDTGHVLWANKTEMSVLGYTPEEYIGQNPNMPTRSTHTQLY